MQYSVLGASRVQGLISLAGVREEESIHRRIFQSPEDRRPLREKHGLSLLLALHFILLSISKFEILDN